MTHTEEHARELFEKLEPTACDHKWRRYVNPNKLAYYCPKCKRSQGKRTYWYNQVNLLSPDWPDFGWMITRAKEAEWWERFIDQYVVIEDKYWDEGCPGVPENEFREEVLTDPTALRNALMEYFGIGGERR